MFKQTKIIWHKISTVGVFFGDNKEDTVFFAPKIQTVAFLEEATFDYRSKQFAKTYQKWFG